MACGSCGGGGWKIPNRGGEGAKVVSSRDMKSNFAFSQFKSAQEGTSASGAKILRAPLKATIVRKRI